MGPAVRRRCAGSVRLARRPVRLSWQVVPKALGELLGDPDRDRAGRVMRTMLALTKLDIAGLQAAYDCLVG